MVSSCTARTQPRRQLNLGDGSLRGRISSTWSAVASWFSGAVQLKSISRVHQPSEQQRVIRPKHSRRRADARNARPASYSKQRGLQRQQTASSAHILAKEAHQAGRSKRTSALGLAVAHKGETNALLCENQSLKAPKRGKQADQREEAGGMKSIRRAGISGGQQGSRYTGMMNKREPNLCRTVLAPVDWKWLVG